MGDITQLIHQARDGDRVAFDGLFSALYPELRRIAHSRLAGNLRDGALDTTMLVHECYLKLRAAQRLQVEDRVHFFAYAATAMRSIIVDLARARRSERRGGDAVHLQLDEELADSLPSAEQEILQVDEALEAIAQLDERLVRVVEMRYFVGLTDAEIAQTLDVTERTVRRDWQKARLLLASALQD